MILMLRSDQSKKETDQIGMHITFQVGILTLLATRGPPPFVPWCWALRDEGDEHDGRTGQYPGDQDHPTASF